ncbi:MAG: nucleotidyltransferase family protein [Acidobacteriota bacterium]
MAQVAALILAGGEGSRYGTPKAIALLPDGESFLSRCTRTLEAAGVGPIAATLPVGIDATGCEGVRALPLPDSGMDMLGSARFGLSALLEALWDRVVIWPVDHPLVAVSTIRRLGACRGPLAVPTCGGARGHPISLTRAAAAALAAGTLRGPTLRDALAACGREEVAVDDAGVLANCNTPARLRAALERIPPR